MHNAMVGAVAASHYEAPAGGGTISGGTHTSITGYEVYSFTANGTLVVSGGNVTLEYLIVAGGGTLQIGGAGGGGLKQGTTLTLTPGSYPIVVGAGGNPTYIQTPSGTPVYVQDAGYNLYMYPGGNGGYYSGAGTGLGGSGGSGGGGNGNGGGNGISGQGNSGGSGSTSQYWDSMWGEWATSAFPGGGGGAGAAGQNDNGVGGDGIQSSITGTAIWYAGGSGINGNGQGAGNTANRGGGSTVMAFPGGSGVMIVRIAV